MASWLDPARKFFAGGDHRHLLEAWEACEDTRIQATLMACHNYNALIGSEGDASPQVQEAGLMAHEFGRDACAELIEEGRENEAALLNMVVVYGIACTAALPAEMTSPELTKTAKGCCQMFLQMGRRYGFEECEAFALFMLGKLAHNAGSHDHACTQLDQAVTLYRALAARDPGVFKAALARALGDLVIARGVQRNGVMDCDLLAEQASLYRELAKDDPEEYRPELAQSLTLLGQAHCENREFASAALVLDEAVDLWETLCESDLDAYGSRAAMTQIVLGNLYVDTGQHTRGVNLLRRAGEELGRVRSSEGASALLRASALNDLGLALRVASDFVGSRDTLEEALLVDAAGSPHAEPNDVAEMTANILMNLGATMRSRRLSSSRAVLERAIALRSQLAQDNPRRHLPELASARNNLGNTLRIAGQFPEARDALEAALAIRRKLAAKELRKYRPVLARTLANLAGTLHDSGNSAEAVSLANEAVEIYEQASGAAPHAYERDVSVALGTLGNALRGMGRYDDAAASYRKAIAIAQGLADSKSRVEDYGLPLTLNNLANALEDGGRLPEALVVSREATALAERWRCSPGWQHLARGHTQGSYLRLATASLAHGDIAEVFRCLAALRRSEPGDLQRKAGDLLAESREALGTAARSLGRSMRIIVAQSTPSGPLIGVLDPDRSEGFECCLAEEFGNTGQTLSESVRRACEEAGLAPEPANRERIQEAATQVWQSLPPFAQRALSPDSYTEVLISADRTWCQFPWEILSAGTGPDDWLGLRRCLARWDGLTSSSWSHLVPRPPCNERPTAAVVCPWDVPGFAPLEEARKEAEWVQQQLTQAGCTFSYVEEPLIGQSATLEAFLQLLRAGPTLLHYAGHGEVVGDSQVLVLHNGSRYEPGAAVLGRDEIANYRRAIEQRGPLLSAGTVVVLNACFSGRTAAFGGQREDIVASFLAENADAVIACPVEMLDEVGGLLGRLFYQVAPTDNQYLSHRFAAARALIERRLRETNSWFWPAWCFLSYHGNPFASLPRSLQVSATTAAATLADTLGCDSGQRALAELRAVEGRLC